MRVDCYFHANVPSVATCADCKKPVCATCRDDSGTCPSCRLAAKIEGQQSWKRQAPARVRTSVAEVDDSVESRILVSLGYPLWPLALISLFDRKQSKRLRKHAYQALGFNLGMAAVYALLYLITHAPILGFLGWSANILFAFLVPVFIVLSVIYGIRAWQGEDVRVPVVSDWLEANGAI